MSDKLSKAREMLAGQILEDFKGKITGNKIDYVVGDNPENIFFVGKLLSNKDDGGSGYSSDVFIESVGADFYIVDEQFESALLEIKPRGDFFYRAYPTLEQQRTAILDEANEMLAEQYESFDSLFDAYTDDPDSFKKIKMKLVPVYKKVKIDKDGFYLSVVPNSLMEPDGIYGLMDETHPENERFSAYIDSLQEEINEDPYRYSYVVFERVTIKDLKDEETYRNFIKKNAKQDGYIRQNWSVYIHISIRKIKEK